MVSVLVLDNVESRHNDYTFLTIKSPSSEIHSENYNRKIRMRTSDFNFDADARTPDYAAIIRADRQCNRDPRADRTGTRRRLDSGIEHIIL